MSVWRHRKLGELTDVLSGFAFDSKFFRESGSLPLVRIRDVIYGQSSTFYNGPFDEKYIIGDGDVLIGMDGEFNRARWRGGRALLNQRVCKIVSVSRDLLDSYLYWFLPAALKAIEHITPFVTVKHLSAKQIRDITIPLPPVSEQHRISAILDKADALRAKRRAAIAQLDTLPQSIFLDMFGRDVRPPITVNDQPVVHPSGWRWELLTDVARLATGHTPDRERPEYWSGDIPWISLTDIRDLDADVAYTTDECVTQLGIDNSSAVRLPPNTVCFSRTASVGFVTIMGREMATSQDFVNWVPGDKIDPTYLMWALIRSRPQLRGLSSGSTHKTIYMRVVEQFRVLLPPIDLQRHFARNVLQINTLRKRLRTQMATMDSLFASLQHIAFTTGL